MDSEALVLDVIEHGESDLIVTFFGREEGRFSAIAKGAKRSKKRFVNKLELCTFLNITYTRKTPASLAFLNEAEIYSAFLNIRKNAHLYTVSSVAREFLLLGFRDGDADEKVFQLSLWLFHNLDIGAPPNSSLALFLIRFFDYVGYKPELERCQRCGGDIQQDRSYYFDALSGAVICSRCQPGAVSGMHLSHGSLKILSSALKQPLERLHRLKISGQVLRETLHFLHFYGRYIYQRDIASWRIFDKYQALSGRQ